MVRDGSGNFITNMITILGTVTNATDSATKQYVDTAVATGFDVNPPVNALATSNITLSGSPVTIDGVSLNNGNQVLAIGQINQVNNGPWVVASGPWTRPATFPNGATTNIDYFLVLSGLANQGSSYVNTTPGVIVGSGNLVFQQFSLPVSIAAMNVGVGQGQVLFKRNRQHTHLPNASCAKLRHHLHSDK